MIRSGQLTVIGPGALLAKRYRLGRLVGEGGAGYVYEARDEKTARPVAVKVLRPELALDPKLAARFVREARIAARIDSDRVTRVEDSGVDEALGSPFIVYELLKGRDLSQVVEAQGALPVEVAVDYVLQVLEAVAAAHAVGIVHRDLKPANLFLVEMPGRPPLVKVLDFGVAKAIRGWQVDGGPATSTRALVGTPLYMAPEQLKSAKGVDSRADLWSVGAILYELVTAATPFAADTFANLLFAVTEGKPTPPEQHRADLPPGLSAVVSKCLDRDKERRFRTARDLARALAPFAAPSSRQLLGEIEEHYGQETEQVVAASEPRLDETVPDSDPALLQTQLATEPPHRVRLPDQTLRMASPNPSSRASTRPSLALMVLGGVAILMVALAVTYFLARGLVR